MYKVYVIKNTINSNLYIGYTKKSLTSRLDKHIYDAQYVKSKNNKHKNDTKFYRALRKYGPSKFFIELLHVFDTKQEACDCERRLIAELNTITGGYNTSEGGSGGNTRSEAQLKKLSEKMKGNDFYKYKNTETISKTSEKLKNWRQTHEGKAFTERSREITRITHKGVKRTEITKKRISDAKKGVSTGFKLKFILKDPSGFVYEIVGQPNLIKFLKERKLSDWVFYRTILKGTQPKSGKLLGWSCQKLEIPTVKVNKTR